MQLTSLSILLLASASAMASPILVERQEQQQEISDYSITAPIAQDTVISGQATTISWIAGKNTPLSIGLTDTEGSDVTNLATEVNGSTGTFLVNIPGNIANCSEHKIVIQYGDQSAYSELFYIAAKGTEACASQHTSESDPADVTLAADKLSGATATASIDILDGQGNPIGPDESFAAKTFVPTTLITALGIASVSYLMMA
ncbi:hypothetical protein INT45_014118, partial [Circinella minor]